MEISPPSSRTQTAKRRSSRIPIDLPVGLSGEDSQEFAFTTAAKATNVNKFGAAVYLPRQLLVGSMIVVRNTRGTEVTARVVVQLAASQGISAYGIEFVNADSAKNFWGISFPPLQSRPMHVKAAEREGMSQRKLAYGSSCCESKNGR